MKIIPLQFAESGFVETSTSSVQLRRDKEWLTVKEVAELMNVTDRTIQRRSKEFETKIEKGLGGERIVIKTSSLPGDVQMKIFDGIPKEEVIKYTAAENDLNIYSTLKPWEKEYVDYILPILKAAESFYGKELDQFLHTQREQCRNGKKRSGLSTNNFYKIRSRYQMYGLKGIVLGYGKQEGNTKIEEESYLFFERMYMQEQGTTLKSCWLATKGDWIRRNAGLIPENFPSATSFLRLLETRKPKAAIIIARKGWDYYQRKYGESCERIYDGIEPGKVWVGDHMQANTAVMTMLPKSIREDVEKLVKYDKLNKPIFPWITAWVDFFSGRWMGWNIHAEAPNSDHIFMAFVDGVERNGCPDEIYIDNGKDYRCKDFSSGKTKKIKVKVDEKRTISLMSILNVTVHFAIPYNPQSKTIERVFDDYQSWLDQGLPGYRGRNSASRPEALAEQIQRGEILDYAEYCEIVNYFIENVLNEYKGEGKNLLGKSRNEVYAKGCKGLRNISEDALKLLCLRVSDVYAIGKHGVTVDQKYRMYYFSEWMIPLKGEKVYLRRNPKKYQQAWVFKYAGDNIEGEYLGKAYLNVLDTAALARVDLGKEQLQNVQKIKAREKKLLKELATVQRVDPRTYVENLAAGIAAERNELPEYKQSNITIRTPYDEMLTKEEEMQKTGTYGVDINKLPRTKEGTKIFTFFTDKEEYERNNKKGNDDDSLPKQ